MTDSVSSTERFSRISISKLLATTTVIGLTASGCVSSAGTDTSPQLNSPQTKGTDGVATWMSFEQSADFWEAAGFHGADEVEGYDDLNTMTDSATAVIVGEFLGVEPGRAITDPEVPEDAVAYPTARIRVVDLLAGELPVSSDDGSEIAVETIGADLLDFEGNHPDGRFVAFLRYKGELYDGEASEDLPPVADGDLKAYRWVSSDGLYVDKDGRAFNPLVEREVPDGDSKDGQSSRSSAAVDGPVLGHAQEMIEDIEGGTMDALVAELETS